MGKTVKSERFIQILVIFFSRLTKIILIPALKNCSGILKSNQIIMLFIRGQLKTLKTFLRLVS